MDFKHTSLTYKSESYTSHFAETAAGDKRAGAGQQETKITTTARIVPAQAEARRLSAERSGSLYSSEKTIEIEKKTFGSNTLPRKASKSKEVPADCVNTEEVEKPGVGTEENNIEDVHKAAADSEHEDNEEQNTVERSSVVGDRKESVGDFIRKISELNENIVKDDSVGEDADQSVTKVTIGNNDAIVKSDDDDDNDDDIDNDSVEDDIQTFKHESSTAFDSIKTEVATNNSNNRRFSQQQKFLNPFEPPCPELVNKSKLIEEFNSVQELNMKNSMKTLDTEADMRVVFDNTTSSAFKCLLRHNYKQAFKQVVSTLIWNTKDLIYHAVKKGSLKIKLSIIELKIVWTSLKPSMEKALVGALFE